MKLAAFLWACSALAQGPSTGRVLVLYEQGLGTPAVSLVDRDIRDVLEKPSSYQIDLHMEYMDPNLFPEPAFQQNLGKYYIQKYHDYRPNMIIAAGPTPIQFMIDLHSKYFDHVPVVICCSYQQVPDVLKRDPDFTGTWLVPDPAKTLDVALQLQPDTKQVIVINGSLARDRQAENIIRRSLQKYETKIQFTYLNNFSMASLLTQIRYTPRHTIILFGSVSQDATGHPFISATQSLPMVIAAANAPVFTLADTLVGQGSVGGYVISYAEQGRVAAGLAMRVLTGEKPRDIPFVAGKGVYLFDWKALKRWGLKERALPAGSVLLNRPPTLWAAYGRYVGFGIFLFLAESFLILELLRRRARERAAERQLRESEDKLRLILDSTAEAIYGIDLEGRCTFCNPACLRALGYKDTHEVIGRDMHDLIHQAGKRGTQPPVEESRVFGAMRSGEGIHVDGELFRREDGTSFPAEYWSYPQWRGQKVIGAVVAFIDITERREAEAALASVSGRLIAAQEQERSRIARELHDDIGQRLAMLSVELAQLRGSSNSPELTNHIGGLQTQASEIAADVQSLSHELHSSRLQYLGMAAAMRGFCKEFTQQQKVEVDFDTHDVPASLSPELSLCFFRVLQEALHNASKHSGVRQFNVRLWGTPNEVHLTISDSGAGFDVETAKASQGLGLASMHERLKLLNGTLSIGSQLGRGTTIHASAPIGQKLGAGN